MVRVFGMQSRDSNWDVIGLFEFIESRLARRIAYSRISGLERRRDVDGDQ